MRIPAQIGEQLSGKRLWTRMAMVPHRQQLEGIFTTARALALTDADQVLTCFKDI